ncbi:MAG: hypothetical protein PHU98_06340 [Mariniphaga sp.]|nr:hypothetical protein [Mariniphaga sp.]
MQETADRIRKCLKYAGFSNRKVSIRCLGSYQIKVITKNMPDYQVEMVKETVKNIYYDKKHGWLICWVNNYCLPMESGEYKCMCFAPHQTEVYCNYRNTKRGSVCQFNNKS